MIRRVIGLYFSPVGGTAKMTEALAAKLATNLNDCSPEHIDYTCCDLLRMNDKELVLDDETIAVIGMPVYIGKVPLPAIKMLEKIRAGGAITVAAVSYGARTYGNALYELNHYAEGQGFKVIGAGAFSVKYKRRTGTESVVDKEAINKFGAAAARKIRRLAGSEIEGLKIKPAPLEVNGRMPVHGVSRIAPGAAAATQSLLEILNIRHKDSEWYL